MLNFARFGSIATVFKNYVYVWLCLICFIFLLFIKFNSTTFYLLQYKAFLFDPLSLLMMDDFKFTQVPWNCLLHFVWWNKLLKLGCQRVNGEECDEKGKALKREDTSNSLSYWMVLFYFTPLKYSGAQLAIAIETTIEKSLNATLFLMRPSIATTQQQYDDKDNEGGIMERAISMIRT